MVEEKEEEEEEGVVAQGEAEEADKGRQNSDRHLKIMGYYHKVVDWIVRRSDGQHRGLYHVLSSLEHLRHV